MKKHKKRILGFLGFGVVVATTAVAVALPSNPEALAATGTTLKDTVIVRVTGSEVDATITQPTNGTIFATPSQTANIEYANSHTVTVTLEYTDVDGHTSTYELAKYHPDYQPGSESIPINLDNYGYGNYKLTVDSEGGSGVTDTDSVTFEYVPVSVTVTQVGDEEKIRVDLDYDTGGSSPVKGVQVDVYLNGVYTGKSTWVDFPNTEVDMDLAWMESGDYTIVVTAYGVDGSPLSSPYSMSFHYESPRSVVPVPNTGGIFNDSNVSQTDYLITGLIIFGIVAVAGIGFIAHNDKKTTRGKKSGRR